MHFSIQKSLTALMAVFLLVSCGHKSLYHKIGGLTFGTIPYNITYQGNTDDALKNEVEKILNDINQSMSTYIDGSTISKLNKSAKKAWVDPLFKQVFIEAQKVYITSNGAFDPTIGPLMHLWGFRGKAADVDSQSVDSVLQFVGFNQLKLNGDTVFKSDPRIYLDFGAIAKGFAVDEIARHLSSKGFNNYLVEIGGEVFGNGLNHQKSPWALKILQPDTSRNSNEAFAIARVNNEALATSGNYKQYKIVDGKLRVHTINPKTGYGQANNLLSASVFASTCAEADALATACMVIGYEKSVALSKKIPGIRVFLIYQDDKNKLNFYQSPASKKDVRISL